MEALDFRIFQFGRTKQPVGLNWRNFEIDMFRLKCKETEKAEEIILV